MNIIVKTIVVALILFGVEITNTNFVEAAVPKTKNIPVHGTKGKVNRKPVTGLSPRPVIVAPKSFSTGKFANQNKVAVKTSKMEKNHPSPRGKKKSMQRERGAESSHSSKDLKYGLKEGLKYGLKYGEKK